MSDDNVVNLQDAYDAAMNRLIAQQQALVLVEAQVLSLRKQIARLGEVDVHDEGRVVHED